jgi:hypothetical protein
VTAGSRPTEGRSAGRSELLIPEELRLDTVWAYELSSRRQLHTRERADCRYHCIVTDDGWNGWNRRDDRDREEHLDGAQRVVSAEG